MNCLPTNHRDREADQRPVGAAPVQLPPAVYEELRGLARQYMRRQSPAHTLQPTALVHEAFLRVANHDTLAGSNQTRLYALCARAMRNILVDHARRKLATKRGGRRIRIQLSDRLLTSEVDHDVLDVNDVLERLSAVDPRQAELVELRVFGGMTVDEAAVALGVSKRTAEREWTAARAWLRLELAESADHDS
jgi:RNA polymerase sigma-70 factor, ECF subfamily